MAWYDFITGTEYGWLGQLIPLTLTVGIAFFLSRKTRDMLLLQFPIILCMKIFFPHINAGLIMLSLALFVMYTVGATRDRLAEVKSQFKETASDIKKGGTGIINLIKPKEK